MGWTKNIWLSFRNYWSEKFLALHLVQFFWLSRIDKSRIFGTSCGRIENLIKFRIKDPYSAHFVRFSKLGQLKNTIFSSHVKEIQVLILETENSFSHFRELAPSKRENYIRDQTGIELKIWYNFRIQWPLEFLYRHLVRLSKSDQFGSFKWVKVGFWSPE